MGLVRQKLAAEPADLVIMILPVKGVTLVGPLPRDVQKITTYSAGLPTKAEAVDAARAFIAFQTGAAVKPKFAAAGLDYKE